MAWKTLRFAAGVALGIIVTTYLIVSTRPAGLTVEQQEMANRMRSFLRSLKERPENEDPAALWKPLLKEGSVSCRDCHGAEASRFERAPRAPASPLPHDEMVALMEEWVEQLNRDASMHLRKAVVCTDCHERDPRRR